MSPLKPLAALCLAATLAACPGEKPNTQIPPDAATCDPADPACNTEACQVAEDCGDLRVFDCVDTKCVAVCTAKADCLAHPAYDGGPWPGCENGLCVCDARKCVASLCSADGECAVNQVCRAGQCASAEVDPDSCSVTPDNAVIRKDEPFTFSAVAYKGDDVALLGANPFTWTAEDASVVAVDATSGTFKGAAATAGYKERAVKATVRAKPSISCHAKVLVLDAISNGARVAVVDELTGRLLTGAKVVINGTTMIEDAANKGVFTATNFTPPATISVFHASYDYVTLVGLMRTDVLVPLRRTVDPAKGGGFQGQFAGFPTQEISFGLAGASLPGNWLDLSTDALVGRVVDTEVTFAQKTFTTPLPTASMLGIGGKLYKPAYQAWGTAGSCLDEAATIAGDCGTSAAFGLMGTLPATAVTPIFEDMEAGRPVDAGRVLAAAIPYLKSFKSAVARDVGYRLKAVPADFTALYADGEAFPALDLDATMDLALRQTVVVPDLPPYMDAAVVVAGSSVPGRGLVPLGMTAGTDTSEQCSTCTVAGKLVGVDVVKDDPLELAYHDDSRLTLRMAPNHGGIEGARYGLVAMAFSTSGTQADGSVATSALVQSRDAMPGGSEITWPGGFLSFVESPAAYDYRTGKFAGVNLVAGASVHRVVFTAKAGKRWIVYFNQAAFDLPKPPAGFEDRTMADLLDRDPAKSPASSGASLSYWALKASDQGTAVDLDGLFDFSAGRSVDPSRYLNGFSVFSSMPTLTFAAPAGAECGANAQAPDACNVHDGNYLFKVRVGGFAVPSRVKLLAEANTGEKLLVETMGADWIASFKFATPLMKDENLASPHVITVTMVKPDSTDKNTAVPIDPKVKATLKVIVEN